MQTSPVKSNVSGRGANIEPIALPIPAAVLASGLSRSAIYREAGQGRIKLLKLGRTTLVDMASIRAFLASLPLANIKPPKSEKSERILSALMTPEERKEPYIPTDDQMVELRRLVAQKYGLQAPPAVSVTNAEPPQDAG